MIARLGRVEGNSGATRSDVLDESAGLDLDRDITRVLTALDDKDLEGTISGDQAPCDDTRCRSTWIEASQSSQMTRTTNDLPPAKIISNSEDIAKRERQKVSKIHTRWSGGCIYREVSHHDVDDTYCIWKMRGADVLPPPWA